MEIENNDRLTMYIVVFAFRKDFKCI